MIDSLRQIYKLRFSGHQNYRNAIWKTLVNKFFSKWIQIDSTLLDLGCGYGEFINNVEGCSKVAMDLNPDARKYLNRDITFLEQDCSKPWKIEPESIDLVFTSNFFEHLPHKQALSKTIYNVKLALKPGGRLIALGPNISALNGCYWDFWDHHLPLSDQSLGELFEIHELTVEYSISRFLPYNMVRAGKKPLFLLNIYLRFPLLWNFFGRQFLLVARKEIA